MVQSFQTIASYNVTPYNNVLPHTQPSSKAAQTAPSPKTSDPTPIALVKSGIHDKVTLSPAAQAKQLLEQGRSVSQIAAALSTTPAAVDSYLGITTSTIAISQVPAATHPISLPVGSSAALPTQPSVSAVA